MQTNSQALRILRREGWVCTKRPKTKLKAKGVGKSKTKTKGVVKTKAKTKKTKSKTKRKPNQFKVPADQVCDVWPRYKKSRKMSKRQLPHQVYDPRTGKRITRGGLRYTTLNDLCR